MYNAFTIDNIIKHSNQFMILRRQLTKKNYSQF
jgi:hypothetical protein